MRLCWVSELLCSVAFASLMPTGHGHAMQSCWTGSTLITEPQLACKMTIQDVLGMRGHS